MAKSTFLYMDVYRCGKIARVAVASYLRHYKDVKLHLFGVATDFPWFEDLKKEGALEFVDISADKDLLRRWNIHGHLGTAHLWAKLIQERTEDFLIHFDSDIVFRGRALDQIFAKIEEGFDLVGSPRNYRNNLNNKDDVRHLTDLVQTAIFAFNRTKISAHPFEELVEMCRGAYNPLGHPVIDFFDPVMFEILRNGGKIHYLPIEDYGGTHRDGHRNNQFGELNKYFDAGALFLHFASVGSGLKYYHDMFSRFFTSASYVVHGLERYWLFCMVFYGQDLPGTAHGGADPVLRKFKDVILEGLDPGKLRNGIDFGRLDSGNDLSPAGYFSGLVTLTAEFGRKVVRKIKRIVRSED